MESIYNELALYGSKNECARTDNVFSPISEVCNGTVSLYFIHLEVKTRPITPITIYWGWKGGGVQLQTPTPIVTQYLPHSSVIFVSVFYRG